MKARRDKIMAKKAVNTVLAQIAGRDYHLATDESPEYVRQLADYVTARIFEIKRGSENASPLDCATVAAFMLADELNKMTAKCEKLSKKG
jgi:cell division protein ZapA (FtsZ GTPase activity inhibitor)